MAKPTEPTEPTKPKIRKCEICNKPIPPHTGPGRPRKFCSTCKLDRQRAQVRAYGQRLTQVRQQHQISLTCQGCRQSFASSDKRRKFCTTCNEKGIASMMRSRTCLAADCTNLRTVQGSHFCSKQCWEATYPTMPICANPTCTNPVMLNPNHPYLRKPWRYCTKVCQAIHFNKITGRSVELIPARARKFDTRRFTPEDLAALAVQTGSKDLKRAADRDANARHRDSKAAQQRQRDALGQWWWYTMRLVEGKFAENDLLMWHYTVLTPLATRGIAVSAIPELLPLNDPLFQLAYTYKLDTIKEDVAALAALDAQYTNYCAALQAQQTQPPQPTTT